ncbi:MAG: vitamin K epoxide reductase family protein [Candidatus Paceibacteria bacterium]
MLMQKDRFFTFVQALSVVGILLAVYLLWEQFSHLPSVCSISSTVNCDAIISGPVSQVLGIPTPLYGLLGYLVILLAATRRMKKTLLTASTLGLAFCFWIAYRELFELHVICPICIACQLIMLTVFSLAVLV